MLQKYDKVRSSLLLAFAAAGGAALSGTATAGEAVCSLDNGYSINLAAYVAEASTCVDKATNLDEVVADALVAEINAERAATGLMPLQRRASLDMAAASHALDMSARIYAAHSDLEGRDHLHRIRAFDRTMLVGASGSNVAVARSADAASDVHNKIKRDQFNQDNILRASFTDIGVAVVEEAGQYYVVQVFAAAEGDLEKAIPVSAKGAQSLQASLSNRDRQVVAWGLSDVSSGEMLARSTMPRVSFNTIRGSDAATLDVLVAVRDNTYVLKGPLVSGR
ncbi:MAG: CAP domain-containing protein [Hyphomonas sp.]|nr:CAP domain-containing protein [Hyphomonas sp.]